MSPVDCRIVFSPSGRRGSFPAGTSVLEAARALGVDLDSVCGGRGLCGRCQVAADGLSPVDADELPWRHSGLFRSLERLPIRPTR